jgi:uncharacterized OsmC-like protein
MHNDRIRDAFNSVVEHRKANPEKGAGPDPAATATMVEGLQCKVVSSTGGVLVTDMPKGLGGGGAAPTPAWFMRAAHAACDATVIAMHAAIEGVVLNKLEVTVESDSDLRGFLGMDPNIPGGPIRTRVRVLIGADGVAPERLRAIVEKARAISPVDDALRRAIPVSVEIATPAG